MRLGDLDALFAELWRRGNPFDDRPEVHPAVVWSAAATLVRESPSINPEDLPIVQQLRKHVQDLDHQLSEWKFWYGPMREREAKELRENQAAVNVMRKHCEKTIAELRKELARVTAERDAAVKDLDTICDCDYCANDCANIEEDYCKFCDVEGCSCRGCIDGGNWTWRGPQKEE